MTKHFSLIRYFPILLVIISELLLQGCIAATMISGAAIATKTIIDPRSLGRQIDDSTLESRLFNALDKNKQLKKLAHIVVTTYQGNILLTGQAPSSYLISCAKNIAISVNSNNAVYSEIRIGKPINLSTLFNDSWITTKVRSQLLMNDAVKSSNIKVITENSEVFLLGLVTPQESEAVAHIASQVNGVRRVITAFNILK
ncbi:divisome-associated lipoprotein YraP [Candidatus Profftia lariciata]|uniref:division/outer membrane stress-associated lipid-binding lipoprotein n=1 Tax=Candidatus Profftia lariciata TaxID=1987921 RepID=UPI001D02BC6C|nr:division/outer membrane stress-associated lipid-binding lipoprotein [Candidatus Profftia lariciata]UDG81715.1 divisome-associated lipoprotein YraP [Candidatus Profftia lariciata]